MKLQSSSKGTLPYLAPEVLQESLYGGSDSGGGKTATEAVDMWAVGVLISP